MPDNIPDNPRCFARHMGLWLMEPGWLSRKVREIQAGVAARYPVGPNNLHLSASEATESQSAAPVPQRDMRVVDEREGREASRPVFASQAGIWNTNIVAAVPHDAEVRRGYAVTRGGVAVVSILGPMQPGFSKYGGTSTIYTQRAIRNAVSDRDVAGILLLNDSPGGSVDGTADLADTVLRARATKPVISQVENLSASANYWVASQASEIWATPTSEIGSIGVYAVIEDLTGMAAMEGVKVHVVSTGPYKGAGVPGTEITPEILQDVQERVDDVFAHFEGAVRKGRGMSRSAFEAVSTGQVWIASKAQERGLINGVRMTEDTISAFEKYLRSERARKDRAEGQVRLAEMTNRLR